MTRIVVMLGMAGAAMLLGAHAAYAQQTELCILGICIPIPPIGGHHPAPAPLLAAGMPAFVALGGGLLTSRLVRRLRGRA